MHSATARAFGLGLIVTVSACESDINIDGINDPPDVSLEHGADSVTQGAVVTFHGTVMDEETLSADMLVSWKLLDKNGNELALQDMEPGDNCSAPPLDSELEYGAVSCTFRAPIDHDQAEIVLTAVDQARASSKDSHAFSLDPGAAPTCSLSSPTPEAPEGAYFSDIDILLDGTCADASGETAPSDLSVWFETTYQDEQGQAATLRFEADAADTGDTAGDTGYLPALSSSTSGDEVRLFGYVPLPAGTHNLCLQAQDESGNSSGSGACVGMVVHPPNTSPWCEIILPFDGTTGNIGDQVRFEGLVGDDDPDQDVTQLYIEWRSNQQVEPIGYGTPDASGFTSIDEAVAFADPETHTITLYVEDDWGFTCTDTVRYAVGDGPTVEILWPSDGDLIDVAETIGFHGSYEDGQTDCDELILRWSYRTADSTDETVFYDDPPLSSACEDIALYEPALDGVLPEGAVIVYLEVEDGDGNTNRDMRNVEVGDCSQDWYLDLDGDGYGYDDEVITDCTQPSGYVATPGDCDDYAVNVNPGQAESCNGRDDDCDGDIDEDYHRVAFYEDADGDGHGDDSLPYDADGDGVADLICASMSLTGWSALGGDCDDGQPDINPSEAELCDETDHDCDGDIDNTLTYPYGTELYLDADGDGYGTSPLASCEPVSGYVTVDGDCDDSDASINPGAAEICDDPDPVDNDCDGVADPLGSSGCTLMYLDADGDGYGTDVGTSDCVCESNPGAYTADNAGDCDDADYAINPAADEICDDADVDEDCDGTADIEGSVACEDLYYDADGDDYYASGAASRCLCIVDGDYRGHLPGDCDDGDASINPEAQEVCDSTNTDEDCDGDINDADASVSDQSSWYIDADGDGYGSTGSIVASCDQPSGYLASGGDCDDGDAAINPGATELCDASNTDEDCDGAADDADSSATGQSTWYRDADGDSYGTSSTTTAACDQPSGYVSNSSDCNDGCSVCWTGKTESCDGYDNDCDGSTDESGASGCSTWYYDYDNDTYGTSSTSCLCSASGHYTATRGGDCNDGNGSINPGATEVCDSANTDEDCDTKADDADTYASGKTTWYRDADGDSRGTPSSSVSRCDQPSGYVSNHNDCDDTCSTCYNGATEICDGHNNDCDVDSLIDEAGASGCTTYYYDADDDGYGLSSTSSCLCSTSGHYTATRGNDCNDSWDLENPGAQVYHLVTLYNSNRHDHLTTVEGSSEYTSLLAATGTDVYRLASDYSVGYSLSSLPSGYGESTHDEIHRGWDGGCADHITAADISAVNADSSINKGCHYSQDSISLGWLPRSDHGSDSHHWHRCWKSSWTNHRMAYESTCGTLLSSSKGYADNGTVHWIYNRDLSCP